MKYTNNLNLPQPLVAAITNDDYDKGDCDISVTGLLNPPRITALVEKHKDELVEDVSQSVYRLLGQAVHAILEKSDDGSEMAEERLFATVDDVIISGKFDRFVVSEGKIQDYKVTTAYKFKDGKAPQDFVRQLNIYAFLLRLKGYEVTSGEVVGILRDWSKREAQRSPDYPQAQVVILPVHIFDQETILTLLKERVKMYKDAKVKLPECTDEDRWARPTKYAVMAKGKKRALKLCDTMEDAVARTENSTNYVEVRPGVNTRCESYCPVSSWCEQFKNLQKGDSNE